MFNVMVLEVEEKNRVDYHNHAEVLEFKSFNTYDEAKDYLDLLIDDFKANYCDNDFQDVYAFKDGKTIENIYIKADECTRQFIIIKNN